MHDPLLKTLDAASHIGMSKSWLEKRHPHCPPHIKIGRSVRYKKSELDRWLDDRARETGVREGWLRNAA